MVRNVTVCKDGTRLSVQASTGHYCTPRNDDGPYLSVEVGFIEDKDGNKVKAPVGWGAYADWYPGMGVGKLSADVFGWVPWYKVLELVKRHGGAIEDNMPRFAHREPEVK